MAVKEKHSAFAYKEGHSFLHRMPCWIKLILVPVLSVAFFLLPWYFALGMVILQVVLACALKFSFGEQCRDVSAVIFYAVILYVTSWIGNFCSLVFAVDGAADVMAGGVAEVVADVAAAAVGPEKLSVAEAVVTAFRTVSGNFSTVEMLLKILCLMQSAALVFRTSTSLEIREGVEVIETAVRKVLPVSKKNSFTTLISLFVCFIPMVSKIWNQSKRAWMARGGKNGIRMYGTLLPVLFGVGMKKAYNEAMAIAVRTGGQ